MSARLATLVAVTLAVAPATATASHNGDIHSPNMSLIANLPLGESAGDIAFEGNLAVVSTGYGLQDPDRQGFHTVDISRPEAPRLLGAFHCPGSGYDVGVWGKLAFVSINVAGAPLECDPDERGAETVAGIRVVSIEDPRKPVQLAAVTTCEPRALGSDPGSHTHTVVPDLRRNRVLIYATGGCVDVVEVPLNAPERARVIGRASETVCHDVTVLLEQRLAAAACISEVQIWDISNLEAPVVLSRARVPWSEHHHNTIFSADGRTLVIGEENLHTFALPAANCYSGTPNPQASLSFFDISDPAAPRYLSYLQAQHQSAPGYCSAHQFNLVPRRDGRDVLAAGWYHGGGLLVDFTDPSAPKQIAHYVAEPESPDRKPVYWSAYFYRGHVYGTSASFHPFWRTLRGLDVFTVDDAAVAGAMRLPRLNAQTQEPLPSPPGQAAPFGTRGAPAGLRLHVTPRALRAGRPTRLTVRVTAAEAPVTGARVRAGRHAARTDAGGRARFMVRAGTRRLRVRAGAPGHGRAVATLRVRRAR